MSKTSLIVATLKRKANLRINIECYGIRATGPRTRKEGFLHVTKEMRKHSIHGGHLQELAAKPAFSVVSKYSHYEVMRSRGAVHNYPARSPAQSRSYPAESYSRAYASRDVVGILGLTAGIVRKVTSCWITREAGGSLCGGGLFLHSATTRQRSSSHPPGASRSRATLHTEDQHN